MTETRTIDQLCKSTFNVRTNADDST